jgi:peptidyl-prolyl cis-trans isomerase SurA
MKKILIFVLILALTSLKLAAQDKIVDKVIAIVGEKMVLLSDVETQYQQYYMQGNVGEPQETKCSILEEMLLQNLLLNQAEIDSIEVSPEEIESEIDRRLRFFIAQIGSKEKLEEFYNKSIIEIKEEFRSSIRDQILVQKMQAKITEDVTISPKEVQSYFNAIPKDSLPMIESEYQIGEIKIIPTIGKKSKEEAKNKLIDIQKRILEGESFETLAILYSEDPGSAKDGGELGFHSRGELYPEFEAAAFKLAKGETSEIIESAAGFHIIQMIERRGDNINVRHILIKPKADISEITKVIKELDSLSVLINNNTLSFQEAAKSIKEKYKDNESGMMMNQYSGSNYFKADDLSTNMFFTIDKLQVGKVSKPAKTQDEFGKDVYRILYLHARTKPHIANLEDDYDFISKQVLNNKKQEKLYKWVRAKQKATYIVVMQPYATNCSFNFNWNKSNE